MVLHAYYNFWHGTTCTLHFLAWYYKYSISVLYTTYLNSTACTPTARPTAPPPLTA